MKDRLQDNLEKIKLNKQLPYLVANVVELLEMDPNEDEEGEEEGANVDLDSQRKGKCAVVKTTTRTVQEIARGVRQPFSIDLLPSPSGLGRSRQA